MPMPRRTRFVAAATWARTTIGSRKGDAGENGTISSVNASPIRSAAGKSFHQSGVAGSDTCSPDHTDS